MRLGIDFALVPHIARGQGDVVEDGQVGKEVQLLEDHPGLPAHLLDAVRVIGELDPVDHDPTLDRVSPVG